MATDIKILIAAQDSASAVLDKVRSSMDQMRAAGSGLQSTLANLAGGATFVALANFVRGTNDGVDALNDMKDATGASIENLSALEDIANRTGTNFDAVGTALVKFNALLNEAKPGSPAEASLKALGLNAKELKELDPAEALMRYAVAINGFADNGDRARLVQEQLGRSYRELAPLLKDLAEKGRLVATITTEQADEAEKFNKQLFELEKNSKDAHRALVGNLVVGLNAAAQAYRETGSLAAAFNAIFHGSDQNQNDRTLVEQTNRLLDLQNEISSLKASGSAADAALAAKKMRDLAVLQAEIKTTLSYRQLLSDEKKAAEGPEKPKVNAPVVKPVAKAAEITDAQRSLASYVQGLDRAIESGQKLTEVEKAQHLLSSLGKLGEIAQVRELVLGQAGIVDQLKAQEEAEKRMQSARAAESKHNEDMFRQSQALDEHTRKLREQVEEIGLEKDALNELILKRQDAAIATEEQTRSLMNLQNSSQPELDAMDEKIKRLKEIRQLTLQGQVATAMKEDADAAKKQSEEYAKELHNDVKGALSTAFRDTKGDALGAFGDALANVIYTRATNALADSLVNSILGTGGKGGKGGFSLSDLFSFDGGGYTGAGTRSGGLDGKGGFMALLHPNETVLDHTKGQQVGGNGVVVNQPIVINASSASAETVGQIRALMPALIAENKRVVEGVIRQAISARGGRALV